jgi:hypothetical protein
MSVDAKKGYGSTAALLVFGVLAFYGGTPWLLVFSRRSNFPPNSQLTRRENRRGDHDDECRDRDASSA